MVVKDLGVFRDPLEFVTSEVYSRNHARLTRALHWNVLAPLIDATSANCGKKTRPAARRGPSVPNCAAQGRPSGRRPSEWTAATKSSAKSP